MAKLVRDVTLFPPHISFHLGGGFKFSNMFFIFTPNIGEDLQFESHFSHGLKPPTSHD